MGAMIVTHHEYRDYVFTIVYQAQEPAYSVNFPDLPDVITSGVTLAEAFTNACEALDSHLESLVKLGLPLPTVGHRLVLETA
jgi:predicted RNase H-like HicB family nuclease